MATGYTQKILDGAKFQEFALSCARAFGANIMMRDDHPNQPIKVYEADPYHFDQAAEAKRRLEHVATMTLREAGIAADTEYREALDRYEEILTERRQTKAKYAGMLAEVERWQPPTPEHEGLKKFMKEQILSSIESDCDSAMSYYQYPKKKSAAQWLEDEQKDAERDLDYHEKHMREEEARVKHNNAWNQALFESLGK